MKQFRWLFLLGALLAVSAAEARGQQVRLAAASDLQAALPGLLQRFEKETGVRVQAPFGSSGNFFAQIQNGAPFDVFMSADVDYPRRLHAAGFGDVPVLYARGHLALWTRHDSGLDIRLGLQVLRESRAGKIAVANPEHAPYGRAAVAALRAAGIYEEVRRKLVFGENIAQAAQFAQSGNAAAGIVSLSLAMAPALKSAGTYVEIPASLHPPIEQAAMVLGNARDAAAARRFVGFLRRADSIQYLTAAGFAAP